MACGDLVLKPLDRAPAEIAWQADVLGRIREDGFRVTRPVPRIAGGWTAWEYVEGRHEPGRWLDIIAAGERFHAALAGIPRRTSLASSRGRRETASPGTASRSTASATSSTRFARCTSRAV